ncbi:hypothetical protein [Bradyrhizobium sp. B117]|uniref:hypothetical protein n=1 Tax=Bradyrhizobium sp. B117 TaxID=3140246 RepID=UPI0031845309
MGTLFLLPPDFDPEQLVWPNARAIARTLKIFGARLIDQTVGTFGFAGEIGGEWSQYVSKGGIWHTSWAEDLTKIRDSLRPVKSVGRWLDAEGKEFSPQPWERMNLLSMRGPWARDGSSGRGEGGYETTSGLFLFSELSSPLVYRATLRLRDERAKEPWFQWMSGTWYQNPVPEALYQVRVEGYGGGSAGIEIRSTATGQILFSALDMKVGDEVKVRWPIDASTTSVIVRGRPGPPAGIKLVLEMA